MTLLQAYGQVKDSHPAYGPSYNSRFDVAALTNPGDAYVLAAPGRKKAAEKTGKAEAIQLLSRATQKGWTQTSDYALLVELLARSGRVPEGIAVLKRGIAVKPFDGGLYRTLAV